MKAIPIWEADSIMDAERDSALFREIFADLKEPDAAGEDVVGDPFESVRHAFGMEGPPKGRKSHKEHGLPLVPLSELPWSLSTKRAVGQPLLSRSLRPVVEEPIPKTKKKREIPAVPNVDQSRVTTIVETIVPFPSAPIHGVQRIHMFNRQSTLRYSEVFHTLRVLKPLRATGAPDRIFLLHNGLNETESMGKYHQLAARLCAPSEAAKEQRPGAYNACIVCPFPGHLTRENYPRFASKPLDRYLWDGSHLFRQFLRSMVETRWLLSTLVRRSQFQLPSGTTLLLEKKSIKGSRLESQALADEMFSDHEAMRHESQRSLSEASQEHSRDMNLARNVSPPADAEQFKRCILALRGVLGLEECFNGKTPTKRQVEPSIHVLGYSLGGFVARSVFMTWPWAVDSCTSLLSGGDLRSLTPTSFAFAEEWQTVLHSLRYELDEGLLKGRLGTPGDSRIAGIEGDIFRYFKRTFYEVFQQDYRGGYLSRAGELNSRMHHFVGGSDKIVHSDAVFESAPPAGLNVRTIAGLDHFMGGKRFLNERWFVEMCTEIRSLSNTTASSQRAARRANWMTEGLTFGRDTRNSITDLVRTTPEEAVKPLTESERLAVPHDGSLGEPDFGRCLDDLLCRQLRGNEPAPGGPTGKFASRSGGFLFILRNEVPGLLLTSDEMIEDAAILHHDDGPILDSAIGVYTRKKALGMKCVNTHIVLPWNVLHTMKTVDEHRGFPSQGEGAWGQLQLANPDYLKERAGCIKCCKDLNAASETTGNSVRIFSGNNLPGALAEENPEFRDFWTSPGIKQPLQVADLPDCWIWFSAEFIADAAESGANRDAVKFASIDRVTSLLLKTIAAKPSSGDPSEDDPVLAHIEKSLRTDRLKVVSVSKSRYNPRHRGHVVAESKHVVKALAHAALCIAMSRTVTDGENSFDAVRFGRRGWKPKKPDEIQRKSFEETHDLLRRGPIS